MRVRIDRYTQTSSSLSLRSWLYAILGALALLIGMFGGVIGVMILAFGDGDIWERRSGVFLALFTGAFPLAIGALLIWRTVALRRRMGRLRDLAALARQQPVFAVADVQRALDVGPMDAERTVIDAASWGVLDDLDAPTLMHALPLAATTPAPQSGPLPSDPTKWVGAVVGGTYAIERVLGSGGMGIVLGARHVRTGRRYALKTLLPDARVSEEALRRFEREATAASAIGHPNIIAVHDYNVTDSGVHYIVLDLLEGETLEARLSRLGSLGWHDAQKVAMEIGSALTSAHERGLLHRDLKPQNVFLAREADGRERAVLLDFGLVKSMDEAACSRITVTGAVVGTPLYMSPEQARGESIDVRSDVYALGAVVFEMVTGAPPFIDRTLASVYARLLTTPPPNASTVANKPIPAALDAALAKALAKSSADRFPSVVAFTAALAEIADSPPDTVPLPRTA
jgi:serine/threonine-protein kinase